MNEETTQEGISLIKVSEKTASLINVLKLLESTEEIYLNALEGIWGEDIGSRLFSERSDSFTTIREFVKKDISERIEDRVNRGCGNI